MRGKGLQDRHRLLNVAFCRGPLPQTGVSLREIDVDTRDFARFVSVQLRPDSQGLFIDRNRLLLSASFFEHYAEIVHSLGDPFSIRAMEAALEIHRLPIGFSGEVKTPDCALCDPEVEKM